MTKSRWFVVVGLTLITLTTAGTFLYDRRVDYEPKIGHLIWVVVSEVDIPAGTDLDPLIRDNQFQILQIPEDVVIDGAVTSLDDLMGKENKVLILANEQIPTSRVKAVRNDDS